MALRKAQIDGEYANIAITLTPSLTPAEKRRRKGSGAVKLQTTREMRSSEKIGSKLKAKSFYLLSATDGLVPKSRRLFAAVRAALALI